MDHFINQFVGYLMNLGYIGLFFTIIIDALGIPFPGGIMIIMTGFLIQKGDLKIMPVAIAIFTGYMSGAMIAYALGRFIGEPFFHQWGHYIKLTPKKFEKMKTNLKVSAAAFLILGRFIPTVGNVAPYFAGLSKLGYGRFLTYSSIFVFLWGGINLGLGFVFGKSWHTVGASLGAKIWIVAGVILAVIACRYYYKKKNDCNE